MFYKVIENGLITQLGESNFVPSFGEMIEPEEYETLMYAFENRPEGTCELIYKLTASGLYESFERTEEQKIDWYAKAIAVGMITLDEIPKEYREKVIPFVPVSEEEQWAKEIMEEVSEYGY
jgi:hypothetical protein